MSADNDRHQPATEECPLSSQEQTRNLLLFGCNKGLVYLGAPILYIGFGQAALFKRLETSETVANLPTTMYFWMTPLPILVTWYFCAVRQLRPVLCATYLLVAAGGAAVAIALILKPPTWVIIAAVLAHAGLMGCALGVVAAFEWEVIGKGVSPSRRGQALALAFGVGPVLAFLSSLGAQLIQRHIAYPYNFAILFGATAPIMATSAFLATRFQVPQPAVEVPRPPLYEGVFSGFGDFLRDRLIFTAGVATILISCGYNVFTNMGLFTKEALGAEPEQFAFYQKALQFSFKAVTGLLLGWLLMKTHPRAGLFVTGLLCLLSVAWVVLVPGVWFLLAFGLMGAGELWGVYYPNYILSCSPKAKMRRNMAFTSMLYFVSAPAPLTYGAITDLVGGATGDKKLGFQISFGVAAMLLVAALLLVQLRLPARPQPQDPGSGD